jgi:two-component system, NarL family, nitrate/nitrite response regulator NarL
MPSIVCVIVHPSRIVREGLTRILAKSPFEPGCTASEIAEVPSTIADAGEQVLVLIGAREESGLAEDLSAAKASFPDAHVVVVGDANQRDLVTGALGLGATSFVDENVATSTLIKQLELVAQGESVISVLIVKRLLGHCFSPVSEEAAATHEVDERQPPEIEGQAEQKSQLSGREAAILHALVQGASNKVIACQLKITEATVKVHVKAILRKIRVKNRTQAAIWALKCQGSRKRLSVEEDGSPLRQTSLGDETSDTPVIGRVPREGSRESAAH